VSPEATLGAAKCKFMSEVELEDAIARTEHNRASRWPVRALPNRLEPECWPEINPRFHLHSGSQVFTVGSCFAQNVDGHLSALMLHTITRRYIRESVSPPSQSFYELIIKYSPVSIYQEFAWTKRIRDRDGIVTDLDIEPFLLEIGNGQYIDLQRLTPGRSGASREELLSLRRLHYGLFEKAFASDIVVMTLGLIECWLDRKTGQYIEFNAHLRKQNEGGRFAFKRLSYQETYEFTKKTIDLLSANGRANILLTISPQPLARTFTADDVMIANMHSKSVLRAVAGQIAEEYSNVDYLPAYESAMLTKQANVWANDLRHVESDFVGRIMTNLCNRYLSGIEQRTAAAVYERRLSIGNLVKERRFDEARKRLEEQPPEGDDAADWQYYFAVAKLHLHDREPEPALALAARLRTIAHEYGENACFALLASAAIFEQAGIAGESTAAKALAFDRLRDPALTKSIIRRSVTLSELNMTCLLIRFVEQRFADNFDVLNFAAQTSFLIKDFESTERICRACLLIEPHNAEILACLGYALARRAKDEDAALVLTNALALDPSNARVLQMLIRIDMKLGRYVEAEQLARRFTALSPGNAVAHSFLASVLKRTGRKPDALASARRAAELDPSNERYRRYADELAASVSEKGDGNPQFAPKQFPPSRV